MGKNWSGYSGSRELQRQWLQDKIIGIKIKQAISNNLNHMYIADCMQDLLYKGWEGDQAKSQYF